jgi:hypothetical protein
MLYETMKLVALFAKQPIADYNEYLDQKKDFSHPIFSLSFFDYNYDQAPS